jgi:hypothetical protein
MKYGAKKDANHLAIQQTLQSLGVAVYDLSGMGAGFPDLLVWIRGQWELVEIKNPKTGYGRRGMNPLQRAWIDRWRGGPVHILQTVDDAIAFARGQLGAIQIVYPAGCKPKPDPAEQLGKVLGECLEKRP